MKAIVQKIYENSSYSKIVEWGKLLTITASTQVIIQAVGFVSGIIVIRTLSTNEYALYTLANTMLGTMTVLADGGIAAGVMALGGKSWQDRQDLGAVISTGLDLRKKFAIPSLCVSIPILLYLLIHHNASWLMATLIVLALIPTFYTTISTSLLQIIFRLHQQIAPLQKNQVWVNLLRLLILVPALFGLPFAAIAIAVTGIPQIWSNFDLRNKSKRFANFEQKPNLEYRKEILLVVKRVLPSSIYYCLSSQISIWLISILGSTEALARVGAIGRLSMVLNLFSVMFYTLMVPRFARLPNVKRALLSRFITVQIGLFVICAVILTFIYFFSNKILWILGDNFSNLNKEVILICIGSCISLISTCTNQLLSSRGLIVPPIIFITCTLSIQIGLAFIIPLNSIINILYYSIFNSFSAYIIRILYSLYSLTEFKKVTVA